MCFAQWNSQRYKTKPIPKVSQGLGPLTSLKTENQEYNSSSHPASQGTACISPRSPEHVVMSMRETDPLGSSNSGGNEGEGSKTAPHHIHCPDGSRHPAEVLWRSLLHFPWHLVSRLNPDSSGVATSIKNQDTDIFQGFSLPEKHLENTGLNWSNRDLPPIITKNGMVKTESVQAKGLVACGIDTTLLTLQHKTGREKVANMQLLVVRR